MINGKASFILTILYLCGIIYSRTLTHSKIDLEDLMKRNFLIMVGLILLAEAVAFATHVFVFAGPVVISVVILYFVYAFSPGSGQFLASSLLLSAAMLLGFVVGVQYNFKPYFIQNPDATSIVIFVFVALLVLENYWFYLRIKQGEKSTEVSYDDLS